MILTRRSVTFSYVDGDEYIFMDDEDYTPYIFKKLELPQTVNLDIVNITLGIKRGFR